MSIIISVVHNNMYNQFTALDQKSLPMNRVVLDPMQLPRAGRRKKKKLHSRNPYKIKHIPIRGEQAMQQKCLDGLMLLKILHFEHPKQIITANISYRRIVDINSDHLQYFTNLIQLNCSENYLKLQHLKTLPALQKLNIAHNNIQHISLSPVPGFNCLQHLDLSFNRISPLHLPQLSLIPCLTHLDLSSNQLQELPLSLEHFTILKTLLLESNRFRSDHKAAQFWAALASLPNLQHLSVARNKIRGIHTEKLTAGNFPALEELNFGHNIVENQHNLICARNFSNLKRLIVTGNPFATNNQYKGLEMEVYARTGAQVIVETLDQHYLKPKPQAKPTIRFDKFIKVHNDTFVKKKNVLFGIDLQQFSSDTENDSEDQDQEGEPMFVTETNKNHQHKHQKENQDEQQDKQDQQEEEQPSITRQNASLSNSLNSSMQSKSIQYGQFHKVAAQLLGAETQYKKSFDIHTSYKALKKALDRAA